MLFQFMTKYIKLKVMQGKLDNITWQNKCISLLSVLDMKNFIATLNVLIIVMKLTGCASSESFIISPCESQGSFSCRSLEATLLSGISATSTLLLEPGLHTLSQYVSLSDRNSLTLEGLTKSTNATIHCSGLGLIIRNFAKLQLRNIHVSNCSFEILSTSAQVQNLLVTENSRLFFSQSNNTSIKQSIFQDITHQWSGLEITDSKNVKIVLCKFVESTLSGNLVIHTRSTLNIICCLFQRNILTRRGTPLIRMFDGDMRVSNSSFLDNSVTDGYMISSSGFTDRLTIISSLFRNNLLGPVGSVIRYDSDNDLSVIASDISNNVGGFSSTFVLGTRHGTAYLYCTIIRGNTKNDPVPKSRFKIGNQFVCQYYQAADMAICNGNSICEGTFSMLISHIIFKLRICIFFSEFD